ncbi:MAG TPA: DUF6529 family protein [Acidimicrobiales bacterium]|nr:DUF6529 family protein [Acidimicrobiales bacterium]
MTAATIDRSNVSSRVALPALAGGAVAVAVGAYAQVHDPTGEAPYQLFFSGTLNLKVWFATGAVLLALVQLLTALRLYGRLAWPAEQPAWWAELHRLSGTLAFALSLPVAYHCLWALGFQSGDTRVLAHSLLGCAFYGAFATKVLVVRTKGLPGWALPVAGGLVLTVLVAVWLTSSLWFFTTVDFPGF